jgi:hypothetical protein
MKIENVGKQVRYGNDPGLIHGNLKTAGIWDEAGFIPPDVCIYMIEFLHRMYFGGTPVEWSVMRDIFEDLVMKHDSWRSSVYISDPEKMQNYAQLNNIPVKNRDQNLVALDITKDIIEEYFQERHFDAGLIAGQACFKILPKNPRYS